ncbi:DUF5312 family protein [Spirochaetia bacterium 38H-sp]|uniref:DUF5312 family protein n=1 Tax=Rarispira pelagica TaxID=3141764 RepID=A0ABU9U9R2_9SPIR
MPQESKGEVSHGFFARLLDLFFSANDPVRARKRELKNIAKSIKKSRYKFYNPKTGEMLPQFAQFFFQVYRVIGPAQTILQHAENSKALRHITIEYFVPENKRELFASLDPEVIKSKAREKGLEEVALEVHNTLADIYGVFGPELIERINTVYETMMYFVGFIKFDYYFLLRKFDSALPERGFNFTPRFEPINAEYISEDLKDFAHLITPFNPAMDFSDVFAIFKLYKGMEIVDIRTWQRMYNALLAIKRSDILTLIIRHIDKNPSFSVPMLVSKQDIVEGVLEEIKNEAEKALGQLKKERKKAQLEQLLKLVFNTNIIARSKYYTDTGSAQFLKHSLGTYLYTEPFNYLKAFLLDYYKSSVREIIELLIVRGQWTTPQVSQQLSEAYYRVMDISQEVVALDESLGEEGERGTKIKHYLNRVSKEPAAKRFLRQYLDEINEKVRQIIIETAQNLIAIGKILKSLIEDHQAQGKQVLVNWREVENAYDGEIRDTMVDVYKKIYYFIKILQLFVKK